MPTTSALRRRWPMAAVLGAVMLAVVTAMAGGIAAAVTPSSAATGANGGSSIGAKGMTWRADATPFRLTFRQARRHPG